MNFPLLETKRLKLVEITHNHANSIYEILSREEVTKFYGTDHFRSLGEAIKLIDMFQRNFFEKRGIRWGMILKENYKLVGTVGLNSLQLKNMRAEIGYELHPDFWRKGYTSEAILEILHYSFTMLELNRLGAVVYPENKPSVNLLEKMGFTREGLLRDYMFQNNKFHDTYVFSLLKEEWQNSQG